MLHGYDIKITDDDLDECDKENKTANWTEEAFSFINEVIIGIEREVYTKSLENNDIKKGLKDTNGMLIGNRFLEYYLIQVYKQLSEKTDDIIVEKFNKLGTLCDEKPIFMLNLISNVLNKVYPMMPRSKLDPENKDKYTQSVIANLMLMKNYIMKDLEDYLKKVKEAKKNANKEENDIMEGKFNFTKNIK